MANFTEQEWEKYLKAMEDFYDIEAEMMMKFDSEWKPKRTTKGGKGFKCGKCGKHRLFQYHNTNNYGEDDAPPFLYICAECGDSFEEECLRELKKEGLI